MGVIDDAGTLGAARCAPVAIFVRIPKTEILVGLVDIKTVVENETDEGDDADKGSVEAYFTALKEEFGNLNIPWDTMVPKIKALIFDVLMGAPVDLLNRKHKRNPILWVRDAAHLLMYSIATAKNGCKG